MTDAAGGAVTEGSVIKPRRLVYVLIRLSGVLWGSKTLGDVLIGDTFIIIGDSQPALHLTSGVPLFQSWVRALAPCGRPCCLQKS